MEKKKEGKLCVTVNKKITVVVSFFFPPTCWSMMLKTNTNNYRYINLACAVETFQTHFQAN